MHDSMRMLPCFACPQGAAAALSSHRSVASMSAFLTHPDSRGVFQCDMRHGTVTVNPNALRLAAGRGLAEAVAAAWPGEGPLPRLRRAAAELLARAMTFCPSVGGRNCATGAELVAGLVGHTGIADVPPPRELPSMLAQRDPTGFYEMYEVDGVSEHERWHLNAAVRLHAERRCRNVEPYVGALSAREYCMRVLYIATKGLKLPGTW